MHPSNRIFREACNGYGFVTATQKPEGLFCSGCLTTHKRPTKLYTNDRGKTYYCKDQVVRLFNPEH